MWQQNSWCLLFQLALPLPFLNKILPSSSIPKTKPTILPQNLTQTYIHNAFTVRKLTSFRENGPSVKQEADLATEAGMGLRAGNWWGESKAQTVLAASSYLLTVSSFIAQIYEQGEHWPCHTFLSFTESSLGNLVKNWHTGKWGLTASPEPSAGNDENPPAARSAISTLTRPASHPPSPPQPRDPAPRPVGAELTIQLCPTVQQKYCQGIRGVFGFESLQWKTNASLSKIIIMLGRWKLISPQEK